MNENMKLCPFCGGEGIIISPDTDEEIAQGLIWYHAGCENCQIWFADDEGTMEGAIAKWNTRSEEKGGE